MYDGDAMSFFLIPESLNDLADKNASPATQLRYESTDDFIWKPNQDMLYGLTLATRILPTDIDNLPSYLSYDDVKKDYDDQKIMYPTDLIIVNGVVTSYARETVGEIIRKPVSDLYGEGYVSSDNLGLLLAYIYQLKDFTTVYQKLVEFALEVLTLEGATVPSLQEMISVDTSKFTSRMKELVAKSQEDPMYYNQLEEEYQKFIQDQVKKLSPDLTRRVKDSGRMKMQQIVDMSFPQMTCDADGRYYVAENALVNGLSHEDYVRLCVNNRSLLGMKQQVTPESGYFNRQLIQAGQGIKMDTEVEQKPNPGVWIPRNRAEGRTTVEGEVLGQSDSKELVLVKSFAMSSGDVITPDLVSQTYNKFEDQSNIGLKFTSAVAGSITQGALSLKHSGILRKLNPATKLIAPEDCSVRRMTVDTIEITEVKSKKVYNHFVPTEFLIANPDGKFKKGDVIGFLPTFVDPGYKSRTVIDLLGALSTEDIGKGKHQPDFALCVAPIGGTVKYDYNYIYIDGSPIPRDPNRVYRFFEGQVVKKYDILCDGILDCRNIVNYCPDARDYYGCFRSYFLSILPNVNEQTVEYVFSTINSYKDNKINYIGIKEKVRTDKSIITNLGYEGARLVISGVLANPEGVVEDPKEEVDLFSQYYLNILADHT